MKQQEAKKGRKKGKKKTKKDKNKKQNKRKEYKTIIPETYLSLPVTKYSSRHRFRATSSSTGSMNTLQARPGCIASTGTRTWFCLTCFTKSDRNTDDAQTGHSNGSRGMFKLRASGIITGGGRAEGSTGSWIAVGVGWSRVLWSSGWPSASNPGRITAREAHGGSFFLGRPASPPPDPGSSAR